jgi:hypothetical protein
MPFRHPKTYKKSVLVRRLLRTVALTDAIQRASKRIYETAYEFLDYAAYTKGAYTPRDGKLNQYTDSCKYLEHAFSLLVTAEHAWRDSDEEASDIDEESCDSDSEGGSVAKGAPSPGSASPVSDNNGGGAASASAATQTDTVPVVPVVPTEPSPAPDAPAA